jgi:alpha-galactosidase
LNAGTNSIQFGNPISYPPDMDQIVISGDGSEPYPGFSVYEAENATLGGAASSSAGFCGNCSGLASVGNLGGNPQSTVTFDDVSVPVTGTYQMEVDYMTQGQRSFFVSVNGNTAKELDLNGYSFGTPTSTVIQVQLHAGSNQIEFSNPSNYAPNLDSIIISPPMTF